MGEVRETWNTEMTASPGQVDAAALLTVHLLTQVCPVKLVCGDRERGEKGIGSKMATCVATCIFLLSPQGYDQLKIAGILSKIMPGA